MNDKPDMLPGEIVPAESLPPTTKSARSLGEVGAAQPWPLETVEAEWVRRYPARRRVDWGRYLGALFRLIIACALTWLFYVIPPESFPGPFQNWKNPIIIFLLVCYIGKTMLDTFFYDHYQP
jgi:hypothetical protein